MRLTGRQARRGRTDLPCRAIDHRREEMVVQVLADALEVDDDVDAGRAQMFGGADPREQEEMRRADRAAAQDDAVRVGFPGRPLDTGAPCAVEQQASNVRASDYLEVLVRLRLPEERRGCAETNAVANR